MKIIFSLHDLAIGGTTVNAVELAAALRDRHGHDVVLFASPGPMAGFVASLGIRHVAAPVASFNPFPARMKALRELVRLEHPDLIYAWETWSCLDAYLAVHLPVGVPLLVTDMQMDLTHILPQHVVTTFGTPKLALTARALGWRYANSLVPPVDTKANTPNAVDSAKFREMHHIGRNEILLVTVSRLVDALKGESLTRSIHTVCDLSYELPLRLVIVGDGIGRHKFEKLANEVNNKLGRPAVLLPGAMVDPRIAYSAADIVIGMGSSALRAMAFEKPTIVVGEASFSAVFSPETSAMFLHQGLYGRGDNILKRSELTDNVYQLASAPSSWQALGKFSRSFVEQHFCIDVVSRELSSLCHRAVSLQPRLGRTALDAIRTTAIYLRERRFLWRSKPPAGPEQSGLSAASTQ